MKLRKLGLMAGSAALVLTMMTGCGGGSSSGTDGGTTPAPPAPPAGLTPEDVNAKLDGIAKQLGCDYTPIAMATSSETDMAVTYKSLSILTKVVTINTQTAKSDMQIVAKTEPGTCGGSVTMPDDGFIGTISFNNYCIDSDGAQATIDGSLLIAAGEAGGSINVSTPTPLNIKSTNPATGEGLDATLNINGMVVTQFADDHIEITAASIAVTDNTKGETYSISNLNVNIPSLEGGVITFSGTFSNPLVEGALQVSGSLNSETGETILNATDVNGDKVTLSGSGGILDASFNGEPVGEMDCTMVSTPL